MRVSLFRLLRLLLVLAAVAIQLAGTTSYPHDRSFGFGWCGSDGVSALQPPPDNGGLAVPAAYAAITSEAGAVPLVPDDIVVRPEGRASARAVASWTTPVDAAIAVRMRPPPRGPPQAV